MKGLKLSELKEDCIYWCQLSERKVLYFRDNESYNKNWVKFWDGQDYGLDNPRDYQLAHVEDYIKPKNIL